MAFIVGQKVSRIAFMDCFGVPQPQIDGLIVTQVQRIQCKDAGGMEDYDRILAESPRPVSQKLAAMNWATYGVEAAERFFQADASCN